MGRHVLAARIADPCREPGHDLIEQARLFLRLDGCSAGVSDTCARWFRKWRRTVGEDGRRAQDD